MPEIAPALRRVPADDLVLPPLDLAPLDLAPLDVAPLDVAPARSSAARREPAVIGAGDLLCTARAAAPRAVSATAFSPPQPRPAPALAQLVRIFQGLCRSANDNRVRITVWTAILLLLLTHAAAVRIAPELERVIEVYPPSAPGRMISAL